MEEDLKKFRHLIDAAERILVITHIGPDPDAFTSMLLMGTTLEVNFPDKQIMMSTEEQTGDLSPLDGYQKINLQRLEEAIDGFAPQLIIMVDSMNFKRCTRGNADIISEKVRNNHIALVIIDHHEKTNIEKNALYFNNDGPAAVQEVYEILFNGLRLVKPDGYAQTTMLGLYSDSGGFIHDNPRYKDTFDLVKELITAGANLEKVDSLLNRHSLDEMKAIGELSDNLAQGDGYNFSYVSDEFTSRWVDEGKNFEQLKIGVSNFVNIYIRNIGEYRWGFVIYKDLAAGDGVYGASFRSITGVKNVAQIAAKLGGGGHIPAAGAKFKAESVQDALAMVIETIEHT